ncbi:MAG: T9SS type A sorting domain-containing protein [Fibrobacter intestinalis]|nr:T9SS type A sorting domain-containing protein [Fibrobacter intestinalis]MDD7299447.1 T9SS type A sorting domain-containing protein [Fibrobacter intestinalis]
MSGCCSWKIYSSSGEVLMQGVHEKSGEISIRNLPAGHYILKVQGNSQSHSYPFRKL